MQRNVPVVVQEVGLTEKHESRQAHISNYTMYTTHEEMAEGLFCCLEYASSLKAATSKA